MTVQIDVWSDFVCPYCCAVAFSLRELRDSHAVDEIEEQAALN